MAATDSIMYSLERNWEMIESAISELDYETMARLPNEHSNSIAWIFGHISRVTDMFIMHRLQSKPELWFAGPAGARNMGSRKTWRDSAEAPTSPSGFLRPRTCR